MPFPVLAAGALAGSFGYLVVSGIVRVLVALGVGFITYQGLDAGLDVANSYVSGILGGFGGSLLQLIVTANVPAAIAMIFSAYTARLTLVLTKRIVFRGPA